MQSQDSNRKGDRMAAEDFQQKLKRNVAENFDQSCRPYDIFEEKYHLFETLALALAEFIDLTQGSHVLDVGCGNGISSRALSDRYGCRILGLDLSEKMIAAGRSQCRSDTIRLQVGDGERLLSSVGRHRFDSIVYNASIFIFPDARRSIQEAVDCLKPGGTIGFSYYPDIQDGRGDDLLPRLFERLGAPLPKYRVITRYSDACGALERFCGPVRHHHWQRPLDGTFLQDLFSIPAQSASLFPNRGLGERRKLVMRLFADLDAVAARGRIVWRLAGAQKAPHP
jgi:SAM-dependent methyltransferase